MGNFLNKIHYGITIDTNSDNTNSNLGLTDGVIRYVSDNIDMSSGFTYEDSEPVTGEWFGDIVKKSGFGKMGSKIDIIAGGDYAFLQQFNLTLVNIVSNGNPYHKELSNEKVAIVGASVKVYVIIDNVLYSRWVGSVSGITFDDTRFIFNCEDSYSSNNTTVNGEAFGMIKGLTLVDENTQEGVLPIFSTPVTRVRLDSPLDDQFILAPSESIGYSQMAESTNGNGSFNMMIRQFPMAEPATPNVEPYQYLGTTTQTDSEYYQIWFQKNSSVDMEKVLYASVSTDPDNKYPVVGYDHIIDTATGHEMTRVLINGTCPIVNGSEQFGNYEEFIGGTTEYNDTIDFDGTVINLFDTGVKILDNINVDNITRVADADGNVVDESVIVEIRGDHYLPFNVDTYKSFAIKNNKIQTYYDQNGDFADLDFSKFNTQYNGQIYPNNSGKVSHLLLDISGLELNQSKYDKVFLGTQIKKTEHSRELDGQWLTDAGTGEVKWAVYSYGDNFGEVKRWVDGVLVATNEHNTETEHVKILCDKINITSVAVYDDAFYGLVFDSSESPILQASPLGLHAKVIIDNPNEKQVSLFKYAGSSNLPVALYSFSEDTPHILTNNGWPISRAALLKTKQSGIPGSTRFNREFNYFSSMSLTADETAPDIKKIISSQIAVNIDSRNSLSSQYLYQPDPLSEDTEVGTIASNQRQAIPAYIDFSLVGQKSNSAVDLLATYDDSDELTGTNTVGKMLSELTGNLEVKDLRDKYFTGKYVGDQVNKFGVVTTLCQQSFLGGFTNRSGGTTFKKIGENSFPVLHHNNDNINTGSIKNFKHSPISKVYNEFEVKYCYNDGTPEKTLEVHNVDEDIFPTSDLDWQTWVVGIDNYNDAKALWNKARTAFLISGVIQKTPTNRTDLKWAVERNWFYDKNIYDQTEEYGFDYFNKLLDWTTYQKFQVNYSLPIIVSTITNEILDDVEFNDKIITPGATEFGAGWITKYEVDPSKDLINVQLTFEPEFFRFSPAVDFLPPACNNIIEKVDNVDTITEDVSNVDNIIEGVCN